MKKKLVLKGKVIDFILELNFICMIIVLASRFTIFVLPTFIIGVISYFTLLFFGGIFK